MHSKELDIHSKELTNSQQSMEVLRPTSQKELNPAKNHVSELGIVSFSSQALNETAASSDNWTVTSLDT